MTNNLTITVSPTSGAGSNWVVRVYKKRPFFRKRISSDWFLNEAQARKFANQLAEHLKNNGSSAILKTRRPGWTLFRALR